MTTISKADELRDNAETERRRLLNKSVFEDDEELRALDIEATISGSGAGSPLYTLIAQNKTEVAFTRDAFRRAQWGDGIKEDDTWLLIGRVYAVDGGPVKGIAGITVRPHFAPSFGLVKEHHTKEEDGKHNAGHSTARGFARTSAGNPLNTELDDNGEFFLPIKSVDFPGGGDIYLQITSPDGTTIYDFESGKLEPLRGGVDNFEIHLTHPV